MDAETRAVIERLVEALEDAHNTLRSLHVVGNDHKPLNEARNLLDAQPAGKDAPQCSLRGEG